MRGDEEIRKQANASVVSSMYTDAVIEILLDIRRLLAENKEVKP
jgi:hypothetical protein